MALHRTCDRCKTPDKDTPTDATELRATNVDLNWSNQYRHENNCYYLCVTCYAAINKFINNYTGEITNDSR